MYSLQHVSSDWKPSTRLDLSAEPKLFLIEHSLVLYSCWDEASGLLWYNVQFSCIILHDSWRLYPQILQLLDALQHRTTCLDSDKSPWSNHWKKIKIAQQCGKIICRFSRTATILLAWASCSYFLKAQTASLVLSSFIEARARMLRFFAGMELLGMHFCLTWNSLKTIIFRSMKLASQIRQQA